MRRGNLIALIESGACTAVIGSTLIALTPSSVNAEEPPRRGCVAVDKREYDAAKREKLLRDRYSAYVRTGRLWRRYYWYCR